MATFLLRSLLWCGPIFVIWMFIASNVLIPTAVTFNRLWLDYQHSTLQFRLARQESSNVWQLSSSVLFQAQHAYRHNSYQPNINIDGETAITVGVLLNYSLGFALSWLLIVVMSAHKLKHLCYVSLIQFGMVVIAIICLTEYKIINLLMRDSGLRILTDAYYIIVPEQPRQWQVTLMKTLTDVTASICILALPVAMAIGFGRPFIYAQLLVAALDKAAIKKQGN